MQTTPDPGHYAWWLASRSAGLVAIVLASVAVAAGLLMAGRISQRPGMARTLRTVHEQSALACLVAIAVHGLTLLGDAWMHPGIAGIALPFQMGYRPVWTGLGIIAGWGAVLLGLSFYVRKQIGPRLWRVAHRFTIVVWALGVVHALGAGTDAATPWMRVGLVALAAPVVGLFVARVLPGPRRTVTPQPSPAGQPLHLGQERGEQIPVLGHAGAHRGRSVA